MGWLELLLQLLQPLLQLRPLLALGFILFVLSFVVLAVSRWLLRSRLKA